MNLNYLHEEIIKMKLNQFSLEIKLILFQIKHFLSRKVWLSFNEEKNQNNILLILTWFFKILFFMKYEIFLEY
jgi:hypothetical protein